MMDMLTTQILLAFVSILFNAVVFLWPGASRGWLNKLGFIIATVVALMLIFNADKLHQIN